jgi:cytoskeletal protein CcmA (bactofilin family)
VPSVIGEDLIITGNVTAKGEIQVESQIEGDVRGGSLLLGENSQVIGNVIAEDVVVRGKVVGSIKALRVTLQNHCHVEGDVFHQSLAVEQGAFFEGRSRRSENLLSELKSDQLASSRNFASPDTADQLTPQGRITTEHKAAQMTT